MLDKLFFCIVAGVLLIIGLPLPLASIIIGAQNANDPCQVTDRIGISLSGWLLGSGIVGLLLIVSICILLTLFVYMPTTVAVAAMVLQIVNVVFQIIYL